MDQINPTQPSVQPQGQTPPQEPAANPGFPSGPTGFAGFQTSPQPSVAPAASVFTPQAETKKKGVGKSVIVVGILVLMLVGLVLGFDKARSFLSRAEGGCTPENLSEANLTPNSVEIIFSTGKTCQVEVAYGTNSESLLLQVPEAMASLNHRIRLSPLLPSTSYYYQVMAEGKKVGEVRSFLTKVAQSPTIAPVVPSPIPTVASGTSGEYTFADFERYFGTANATYDTDKNGIVNTRDWILYQKTLVK